MKTADTWRPGNIIPSNYAIPTVTERQVLIIYTGGTIGMMMDPDSQTLRPFDFEQMVENIPELRKFDCRIQVRAINQIMDSCNMNPEVWIEIAEIIKEHYLAVDGFVVLHGTDTMAFTASALSFMLDNLAKPVVFTGSQLPISFVRTDARDNLITSIEIAISKKNNVACVPEVCIYFEDKLFRANRAFKYNLSNFEAFRTPNYPLLAESGVHLVFNAKYIRHTGSGALMLNTNIRNDIAVLKLYPGISLEVVKNLINADVRGIVMETFGAGNATTNIEFIKLLKTAIANSKVILNISQCHVGKVELGRYETSEQLNAIGVANGYDMTYETAITKMMFLLGNYDDPLLIKALLERNLRGELTQ